MVAVAPRSKTNYGVQKSARNSGSEWVARAPAREAQRGHVSRPVQYMHYAMGYGVIAIPTYILDGTRMQILEKDTTGLLGFLSNLPALSSYLLSVNNKNYVLCKERHQHISEYE